MNTRAALKEQQAESGARPRRVPAKPATVDAPPISDDKGPAEAAPRPPGAEEIIRLMARAEAAKRKQAARDAGGAARTLTFAAMWGGLAVAFVAIAYLLSSALGVSGPALLAAVGAAALLGPLALAGTVRLMSPGLAPGAALRRVVGDSPKDAAQLAGSDMLTALGIAESVLDADEDARLVTRRDGVVIYANPAYLALGHEADVVGPAGLPPRIDRLFAQHGAEATKVFRLCRAAKSGVSAEEVIAQAMSLEDGGRRRRFDVALRPIPGAEDHVSWRLRELPAEEEAHDALAAAYADFVRPVFAVEKSGQIAWANAAMRTRLGAERGALSHIDDVVLGETSELVRKLWQIDQAPAKAKVRQRRADPAEAGLTAFRRGGVGEGFVCVELAIQEDAPEEDAPPIAGDMTEAPFGVAVVEGDIGREARIVEANKAFTDVFGGGKKNAPLARAIAQDALHELAAEIRRKQSSGGAPRPVEALVGDGPSARAYALYARPVRRRRGGYGSRRTLLYSVDVTDRKRMEEDHALDQKLKAIGRLTGEVAHDFNNLLQVVLGNCERLMLRHPAGDPAYRDLVLIRENSQRAANMTKQLLAFSRKQTLKREAMSITELLRDFARFLNRAVGEKVLIDLVNGRGLPMVRVDKNQLESAIMNLAVNARDAMAPDGGKLTIKTSLVTEKEIAERSIASLGPGDHLLIEVSDTGPGVSKEIVDKIFDPFFTTKDVGKGTGLGLSTVHGIIGQMEGAIFVGESPGGGALFSIYLPAYRGEPVDADNTELPAPSAAADLTGAGRVLAVEDEDAVRGFVVTALEDCGYEVTPAGDGEEAFDILAEDPKAFDLIITDVMMPLLDGPGMVRRARDELGIKAKVVFMSAYAETSMREELDGMEGGYIQKPFTLKGLAAKVKQALSEDEG